MAVEPVPVEQVVEPDEHPEIGEPGGGQVRRDPADRPVRRPTATQPFDPGPRVHRRPAGVVERVVDHQPPRLGIDRFQLVVTQVRAAQRAEDDLGGAPGASPHQVEPVAVGIVGDGDAELLDEQLPDQGAAVAAAVVGGRLAQDTVDLDVDQLQADAGIATFDWQVLDLAELAGPAFDLLADDAGLAARDRARDAAVVERGEPPRRQVAQRRHARRQRGEQQGLDQPVVGGEAADLDGQLPVDGGAGRLGAAHPGEDVLVEALRVEQERAQLAVVEPLRRLELGLEHVGERGVPAPGDDVPQIAQRDDLAQAQFVPLRDEQLAHEFERGPVALQGGGDVDEGVHERRAERVGEPERVPVGAELGAATEHRVPHLGADLRRRLERLLDLGRRGGVLRAQQPPVGDQRQVAVLQNDLIEPAVSQGEHVEEAQPDVAGDRLADQLP